ncbi:OLC1v1026957C2 [Oldenlandia corymbosa var. corymbosa]|nr:OLC1v1026957C2 [Oldenlandia corymbosa var. corymbosa]
MVFIFLVTCKCCSAVRPINGAGASSSSVLAPEKSIAEPLYGGEEKASHHHGNNNDNKEKTTLTIEKAGKKLRGGRLGPLYLNALPKGPTPPSGPSNRINAVPTPEKKY